MRVVTAHCLSLSEMKGFFYLIYSTIFAMRIGAMRGTANPALPSLRKASDYFGGFFISETTNQNLFRLFFSRNACKIKGFGWRENYLTIYFVK